jgi:regulator of nonsense transcripts 3
MSDRPARNKLVIRRLPPRLPEATFWFSAAQWINVETCLWKRYVPGGERYMASSASLTKSETRAVHSRAYVLMVSTEALVNLHNGFDGHVFRSRTGGL